MVTSVMTETAGPVPSWTSAGMATTSVATRRAAAIRKKKNTRTRILINSGFPAMNLKPSEAPNAGASAINGVAAAKAIMTKAVGNPATAKQPTTLVTPLTPVRRSPVPKGDDLGTTLSNSLNEALDKIAGYAADYLYSPEPSPSRAPENVSSNSSVNKVSSTESSSLSIFGLPKASSFTSSRPKPLSLSSSPPPGLAASSSNSSYRQSTEDQSSILLFSPSSQNLYCGSRSYSNSPNARSCLGSGPNLPDMAQGVLQLRPRVRAPNRPPPAWGPPPSPSTKPAGPGRMSAMARMRLSRSSGSPAPPVDTSRSSKSAPSTPSREEKQIDRTVSTSPVSIDMRSPEEVINDKHRKWRIKQKQLARQEAAKKKSTDSYGQISVGNNSTDEVDSIGNATDASDDEPLGTSTPLKPKRHYDLASTPFTASSSLRKKKGNESRPVPSSHIHEPQSNNFKTNHGPLDHEAAPKKSSRIGDCIILTGSQKVTDITSPNPIQLLHAFISNNCATIMSDTLSDSSDSYTEYTRDDDDNSLDSSESGSSIHSRSCASGSTRGRGRERPQSDDDTVYTNSDPVAIHKKKNTLKNGPGRQKANAAAAAEADSEAREETDAASVKRGDSISVVSSISRKSNGNGSPNSVVLELQPNFSQSTAISRKHSSPSSKNGNFVKTFIEEITTEGIQLTWHKSQNTQSYTRPTSIHAFIKISKDESEPSLVWDVVNANGLTADESYDGADQSVGSEGRGSVGLFDISSVQKAGIMNLHSYPFAIPGSNFSIVLQNGGVILFEARNDVEAKKYIHGLRWVVARLAFNLIIGNRDVCAELLRYRNCNTSCDVTVATEMEEPVAAKVMDDVTNHLVEKAMSRIKQP